MLEADESTGLGVLELCVNRYNTVPADRALSLVNKETTLLAQFIHILMETTTVAAFMMALREWIQDMECCSSLATYLQGMPGAG
ncbi:hypothetical protein BC832DRAFT_356817 [Gaertneriomyces semiglobifer]|nr:hypothetical protein BC832DRAFT_356817 [Gaertneriomyces semiglobifer]